MEETTLAGFLSGIATAFFALHAYQLFRRNNASRLQLVLACIFVQWALFNLKDFLLTLHGYDNVKTQNIITLIDGLSLIGYTCLLYELITSNGWATWRKVGIMILGYLPFFIVYNLYPKNIVVYCYIICLFIAGTIIFLLWLRRASIYVRYIRANFSNIDGIDISWLRVVAWFFITCQLLWVFTVVVRSPWIDCLYYLLSIVLWQITLEYVLHQQPVSIEPQDAIEETEAQAINREYIFAQTLPTLIEEEQLYLNPTLSIKDLATHIGTNRTYLSDYFVHSLNTTFYDYINGLRIERKSVPLMKQHTDYTLERIASESGFQSISTFRRAFLKQKGVTPSKYRKTIINH